MKAVCTSCGRLQDYESDSDKLDRRCLCHRVSAPFPIAERVAVCETHNIETSIDSVWTEHLRAFHPPKPSIADIVEADFRTCARVGHAGPGPVCTRCGEVTEDDIA